MKSGDFEKIVQKMTLKPQFWNLFDFCGYGVFAGIWGLCHSWQVWQHPNQFEEGLLEGVAAGEVDEEVHRGVEHESQVVVNEKSYRWYFNYFPLTFDNNVDVDKFQNP